ncbi:hypothetical protein [Georgenia yuyongxinii]|uniref:DUF2270 domain-containing protein n=1 Tax=Georgenia yuyongxinii TaxID=2589797 RepID=A0A552WLL3_9MICO|nr:hypothetical protein [Georgenia yuyongxinii]TRW43655.1 hypothetical protein FJ693_16770 [Georgenia yuyongxinii]
MTADPAGHAWPPDDASRLTDAQKSLRAQMLATEHWSLLASRSTTQSEVLTRIAIFLTLVSAGLVTLGVLGNATQFRGWFGGAALGVLLLLVLLGLITLLRVYNVATEDLMYVLAMNRLRGAYLDLDPGLERYFLMSADDDRLGAERTYHYFFNRGASHMFASSMMVITVVTAVVIGLFAGSLAVALGGAVVVALAIGTIAGVLLFVGLLRRGYRLYLRSYASHVPLRQTRPASSPGTVAAPTSPTG